MILGSFVQVCTPVQRRARRPPGGRRWAALPLRAERVGTTPESGGHPRDHYGVAVEVTTTPQQRQPFERATDDLMCRHESHAHGQEPVRPTLAATRLQNRARRRSVPFRRSTTGWVALVRSTATRSAAGSIHTDVPVKPV